MAKGFFFLSIRKVRLKYHVVFLHKIFQRFLMSFRMKLKSLTMFFQPLNYLDACYLSYLIPPFSLLLAQFWPPWPSWCRTFAYAAPFSWNTSSYTPNICITNSLTSFVSLKCHFIRLPFIKLYKMSPCHSPVLLFFLTFYIAPNSTWYIFIFGCLSFY